MSDDLYEELLSRPVGRAALPTLDNDKEYTSSISIQGNKVELSLNLPEGQANEGTGLQFLEEEGLNPDEWETTSFSKSRWGSEDKPMESVKFGYKRKAIEGPLRVPMDDLIRAVENYDYRERFSAMPRGPHGIVVGIGDMQFGKIDGDGPEGTLMRTLDIIHKIGVEISNLDVMYPLEHIHVVWLGDHVEGFVSQGGANVWRTQLTLNEQIRLTRRVMMKMLETVAPLAPKVTMAAVPGNHGEAVRFNGHGITRYDDSHDTEALIAVSEAASLAPDKFGHVEFFVPDTDELTVVTEVAGTVILQAHGHAHNPGKHFEWWKGQAFHNPLAQRADVLMEGHLHHEEVDTDGYRTFIGVPALESESTWWRHKTGTPGAPGAFMGVVRDGKMPAKFIIS
jgi:hypothetical protein